MNTSAAVQLKSVWVHYDRVSVLEDIDLTIGESDFLGLIGPNGGGKTTLLKVILGLLKPSSGDVTVFGQTPAEGRRRIGYVAQHAHFDEDFPASVWEVVLMGRLGRAGLFRRYSKADREAAARALDTVEMLAHKHRQVGKLSGGEQQRVLIARALTTDPKLLILDEPTANVDAPMQKGLYELLATLKTRMAILLVSHDISAVSVNVDKVACLNRRLFYHNSKEISPSDLEAAYKCPVDMIAHGVPHRILKEHRD